MPTSIGHTPLKTKHNTTTASCPTADTNTAASTPKKLKLVEPTADTTNSKPQTSNALLTPKSDTYFPLKVTASTSTPDTAKTQTNSAIPSSSQTTNDSDMFDSDVEDLTLSQLTTDSDASTPKTNNPDKKVATQEDGKANHSSTKDSQKVATQEDGQANHSSTKDSQTVATQEDGQANHSSSNDSPQQPNKTDNVTFDEAMDIVNKE